ncbi:syntaxin-binding protein-like protein 2 [Patellaria atrata CBS 101060]|uniref:Syntaxin-binding protein-like protein 2 n=1 Tax=Patellaria atrata CBS 101060 TaxID=1346257 RepID=A0A9P4S9R5_9PEZI|nr:syntaxin-binding protein-like protein 2 [Patellaria atrata CBS 101060]
MGVSIIDTQRDIIIDTIRNTARGEWKVLVLDTASRKLVDNVVKEDDILNENITNIEQIEDRRPMNKDMDAIYLLSPLPHIVDCIMADFERRRYRRSFLIWTSLLAPPLRERIDRSAMAREQIALFRVLNIDFFPRESHVVTFRDPWSFPILFHPACNNLVRQHMEGIAQKVVSVCVSLGEYPTIRYYRPREPTHEASVLCSHLARFIQDEIDQYAKFHENFPPVTNRPRGALYIVDRSMDLIAPFVHEFTYQSMAHDLLPIKEGDKVTYKTIVNEGRLDQEEKELEIGEKDKIWVENRHRHMKDTIEKLMGDFQKFIAENPHFTQSDSDNASNLNAIKDMLAGLPQFQEMKEAYSLHLSMAQECMNIFEHHKLPDLASVEQSLATGLDEDYRKPKNLADQIVRTLDEEAVNHSDRLRLITLYLLYKDGLLPADLQKLLLHAQLPSQDGEMIQNLELLGARVAKPLKDTKPPQQRLFPQKPPPAGNQEEYALSRFETAIKHMLEDHVRGSLEQTTFPYTKPHTDTNDGAPQDTVSAASLRSAKPTWAKSRLSSVEPRQRVIIFMAGGATYSESRACYEISRQTSRDVFLVTSHMLTPGLFMRQVGDLSVDKRRLGIPAEQPPPKAPAHLFEKETPPKPPPHDPSLKKPVGLPKAPAPPVNAMHTMSLNPAKAEKQNGSASHTGGIIKLGKEPEKKKKKHHFFGSSKS